MLPATDEKSARLVNDKSNRCRSLGRIRVATIYLLACDAVSMWLHRDGHSERIFGQVRRGMYSSRPASVKIVLHPRPQRVVIVRTPANVY